MPGEFDKCGEHCLDCKCICEDELIRDLLYSTPSYIDNETIVLPDTSNIIRFNGTMEEFKKYLPELYEKLKKENDKSFEPSIQCCEGTENFNSEKGNF